MIDLLPIPNHPGYSLSKDGLVFSHWKRVGTYGRGTRTFITEEPQRQVKGYYDRDGYYRVQLCPNTVTGAKLRGVHQLVLEANGFERPSNAHEAMHRNGVRSDNRIENLKWGTAKENAEDRTKHGSQCGVNNPLSKLTIEQVLEIRTHPLLPAATFETKYGASKNVVSRIRSGKTYQQLVTC